MELANGSSANGEECTGVDNINSKPMIPNLIGISGKAGHGKDTLGIILSTLIQNTARPVRLVKFATVLKQVAGLMLNEDPNKFEDADFKKSLLPAALQSVHSLKTADENTKPMWTDAKTTHDYRWFLQHLGTEVGRALHPQLWIHAFFASQFDPKAINIVTDVRFKNEADVIREKGGIMIRIHNGNVHGPRYLFSSPHASEVELDTYDFDYQIANSSTIQELTQRAAELVDIISLATLAV